MKLAIHPATLPSVSTVSLMPQTDRTEQSGYARMAEDTRDLWYVGAVIVLLIDGLLL